MSLDLRRSSDAIVRMCQRPITPPGEGAFLERDVPAHRTRPTHASSGLGGLGVSPLGRGLHVGTSERANELSLVENTRRSWRIGMKAYVMLGYVSYAFISFHPNIMNS